MTHYHRAIFPLGTTAPPPYHAAVTEKGVTEDLCATQNFEMPFRMNCSVILRVWPKMQAGFQGCFFVMAGLVPAIHAFLG